MGRRAHAKSLNVWMNGLPVGTWETTRDGEKLTYLEEWLADQQGRPLSLSLPFTAGNQPYRGEVVSHYFDNLLPDSKTIRERIAGRYKTGGTSPFELLAKLGRDCVGAIQLLPPDETPANLEQINGRPLNEADIARLLRETTASPVLGHHEPIDDLRLSIAGAQEKTALLWHDDRWFIPEGSTPTTHVSGERMALLENCRSVWFAHRTLRHCDLRGPESSRRRAIRSQVRERRFMDPEAAPGRYVPGNRDAGFGQI